MEEKILDSVAIEKLRNHSRKLYNLKHALNSYFDCVEDMAQRGDLGTVSLGVILLEYVETMKAEFDDIQMGLEIML